MFCTSLRGRPWLAPVVATLITPPLSLRESQLGTHDIEVPFGSRVDANTGHRLASQRLRCLLLSSTDVGDVQLTNTFQRVQHFAALTGGRDIIIVFLLNEPRASSSILSGQSGGHINNAGGSQEGCWAYSKFQAEMVNHLEISHVPTLPLPRLDGLQQTISKYVRRQTTHIASLKPPATSLDLLQQCTADPPMSQQTAYILSDLFPDVRALALACSSVASAPNSSSPSARAAGLSSQTFDVSVAEPHSTAQVVNSNAIRKLKTLRDLVGDRECQSIVDFWKEEFLID